MTPDTVITVGLSLIVVGWLAGAFLADFLRGVRDGARQRGREGR